MENTKKLSSKEIEELCEKNGLCVGTYYRRIKAGWGNPFAPAQKKYNNKRPVTVNGVKYPSLHAACKDLGANYRLIYHRIKYGYKSGDVFNPKRETYLPLSHAPCEKVPDGYISLTEFGGKYPALRKNVRHSICNIISNRSVIRHFCKYKNKLYVEEEFWKDYMSYFERSRLVRKFNISGTRAEFRKKLKENNFSGKTKYIAFKIWYYLPQFVTEKI